MEPDKAAAEAIGEDPSGHHLLPEGPMTIPTRI